MNKFATALFVLFFAAATANAQVNCSFDGAGLISLIASAKTPVAGVEFTASGDLFAAGPSPFTFVLANNPTQVTLASIPDVTLPEGSTPTETSWTGSDGTLRGTPGAGANTWKCLGPTLLPPDCNGDGKVDADDLGCVFDLVRRNVVLNVLNTIPGDLDGNGDVSFDDFSVLSASFGQDDASYADGNIDLEDGVAFADFLILSDNFGKTPGVTAVPETNACVLVWFGLLRFVAFRRRRSR